MKNILFFNLLLLISFSNYAQKCDAAFLSANYAVSNTNKAYESNNTAHIQEWTEKAMEAFNEVEEITAECGCIQVSDFAYEGYLACDKAQVEEAFEQSRFYAKRARDKAKKMMDALSKCTNMSISDIQARQVAGNDNYSTDNAYDDDINNDLNAQQDNLLAKQKELLAQQRLLQQQIAAQEKQVAELKQKRATELLEQKRIKINAELALAEIQKNYEKLATSVGCSEALKVSRVSFSKNIGTLEKETLSETKMFYAEKLNEIVEKFNQSFSQCSSDW